MIVLPGNVGKGIAFGPGAAPLWTGITRLPILQLVRRTYSKIAVCLLQRL